MRSINVSANIPLARELGVTTMPFFIFYKNGLKIDQLDGRADTSKPVENIDIKGL